MGDFAPVQPQNVPILELNKGIILNKSPQRLDPGALLDCSNYFVTPNGLKRRPGIVRYGSGSIDYQPMVDIASFYEADGSQSTILVDSKFIYVATGSAFIGAYWVYDTGTISATGAAVTGSSTSWNTAASKILAGDVMILDADGSGDGPEEIEISAIGSDTAITLVSVPTGTYGAGTDYEIRRAFGSSKPELVDYTYGVDHKLLFVDSNRASITSYDGTDYEDLIASLDFIPSCITYFSDRIWVARLIESSVDYRQRIRWTNAGSFTEFPAANYIDLPYIHGKIQRLLGMGNLLIAYFEDAIFLGRPSNYVGLPYAFDRMDTGTLGLVGMKALTSWLDSHFFVAQDDIYMLSNEGLKRIGTPIISRTIKECSNLWKIYAVVDAENDRICFGFPKSGENITEIWSWNYKSNGWSYDTVICDSLASVPFVPKITWGDMTTETWTTGITGYTSWDSLLNIVVNRSLYLGNAGELLYYSSANSQDTGVTISGTFITPDFDLGAPDIDKSWNRVSLKTEEVVPSTVTFAVSGSLDRGNTWTSFGNLVVHADTDEGKIDFMITGSLCRFRFVSVTNVVPYVVNELVFRARPRGLEVTQ